MSPQPARVPLILVNAFPVDKEQWEPLLAALDEASVPVGDIITFDPPGIGDMPATEEPPSLDLIADAAVAAMREATGAIAALWVGCSMGGYVALAVLDRHPDAVAGIGLLGTRATADTPAALESRHKAAEAAEKHGGLADPAATAAGLLGATSASDAVLLSTITANAARQKGQGIAWGQLAMAARPSRLDVLKSARVPGFVARGDEDGLTTADDARAMADALGVEPVVLKRVGHLVATEAPAEVAALIAQLVKATR